MARRLTPGDVLCTHLVRNDVFTDGRRLEDTVQELQRDPHKILPKMKFVEFEGVIWSRSSRRLQCYQKAGATVLIEGVHFRMHAPDPHFFDGLNSALFFASQPDGPEKTYCSLCRADCKSRCLYISLSIAIADMASQSDQKVGHAGSSPSAALEPGTASGKGSFELHF